MKSSHMVLFFDILLVGGCVLLLLTQNDLVVQWGLVLSGLTASLVEPFYENAGAITGQWEFHESSLKLGHLSWEMIPIAFAGTFIALFFTLQFRSSLVFVHFISWVCLILLLLTLVVFSWLTFVRKKLIETLWLVIPAFAFALSFSLPEIAGLLIVTVYLGTILETLILRFSKAYTYRFGYRPAVTTTAYAFFVSFCYALYLQPGTEIVSSLLALHPILPWVITIGVFITHAVLILGASKKDSSLQNKAG